MRKGLRIFAALVVVAALGFWAAKGAHRGWTANQVEKRTVDEITGIEAITYEKAFIPGVDFLGGALIGATVLAGVSFAFKEKKKV